MADILLYRADGVCGATEQGRRPPPRAVAHDREQLRRRTIEEAEPVKPQRNDCLQLDVLQDSVRLISIRSRCFDNDDGISIR